MIIKIKIVMIRILIILFLLTGCSQNQVKTHIGTGGGAIAGFTTCRTLLNYCYELTAACTLVGSMIGSSMFYKNDYNLHTAVFVDTLNTAPGKTSNTNWGNAATGSWGSVKINRTYLNNSRKCRDYTSVISIKHQWPMSGINRQSEWGIACQMPDGRWVIEETS